MKTLTPEAIELPPRKSGVTTSGTDMKTSSSTFPNAYSLIWPSLIRRSPRHPGHGPAARAGLSPLHPFRQRCVVSTHRSGMPGESRRCRRLELTKVSTPLRGEGWPSRP